MSCAVGVQQMQAFIILHLPYTMLMFTEYYVYAFPLAAQSVFLNVCFVQTFDLPSTHADAASMGPRVPVLVNWDD